MMYDIRFQANRKMYNSNKRFRRLNSKWKWTQKSLLTPLTISQDNKIISVGNERFSLTFPPRYLPSKVNIISFDS